MHAQLTFDLDLDTLPETRPTTVYLLQGIGSSPTELRKALRADYEKQQGFQVKGITIAGIPGVASYGVIGVGRKPPWQEDLIRLVSESVDLTNHLAAAAVLLPVDDRVFAVCFGSGHLLLESVYITPSFGLDFALRTVDPSTVSELTHTRMDSRAYTDRSSTARGQHIRTFDLDEYGEICTRVVGRAMEIGLSAERNPRIRKARPRVLGSDSLNVHLALDGPHLVSDLRAIGARLDREPDSGFERISYVRHLARTDPRIKVLDGRLAEALHSSADSGRVALAPPSALLDVMAESQSARVSPRYGRKPFLTPEVTLDSLQSLLDGRPAEERLEALKRVGIQLMSDMDGGLPVGPATDALKWISAEFPLGNSTFVRHQNKWYEIGANHLEYVDAEVRKLFAASPHYGLPAWPTAAEALAWGLKDAHEQGYNELAARKLRWACLDRKLITCNLHPRGFEAADLVSPDGTLVHVKQARSSGPLSHLFVQGHVSADALHAESDANRATVAAVRKRFRSFPEGRFEPRRVVFAIALKTGAELTPDSLFTVSKISLLHTARALQNLGVEVHIQGIDYRARAGISLIDTVNT
ncbi:TIGR04141 family sporadically distributed protein [Kitasatospora sp. NBC_00240]|uniref:DUF6119 family protein n=1 Tax=Kitasatospora sp. NBC_00240 TaxID=2903567 RepID=UPI002252A853|nr:DUF6119 family protein [Kitasatospora sp. NBC_00240]MCX5210078.1 TIGR04141 family sporadically distributed protein [Kitasatospora sp. NBC_00240]